MFKKGRHVVFLGTHPLTEDLEMSPKDRVHMAAKEIWRLTGYRFT